ncbi:unnamed protein product [Leptidea sinapis]|uniref:Uncharacterized protein n=1 Tax=Leptidea sinapis TaxID=189913 RepID=A0A5E4QFS8_9NEOP|nr:unnamed protein product [Leptidea sinapis]
MGSAMLMGSASNPSTTETGSGLMISTSSIAPGVGSNCSTVTESELESTFTMTWTRGVLSPKGRPAGPTGVPGTTKAGPMLIPSYSGSTAGPTLISSGLTTAGPTWISSGLTSAGPTLISSGLTSAGPT